jgi:hypothetical protein
MRTQTEAIELEQELEGDEHENNEATGQGAKLIVEEELQQGQISWKAMSLYLPALSSYPAFFWVAYLVGRSISEGSEILGKISSDAEKSCSFPGQRCGGWDTLLMVRQARKVINRTLMHPTAYSSGGPVDVVYYRACC